MNTPTHDNLDSALRRMTTWPYGEVDAWKNAVDASTPKANTLLIRDWLNVRTPKLVAAGVVLVIIGGIIMALLPSLARARSVSGPAASMPPEAYLSYPGEYDMTLPPGITGGLEPIDGMNKTGGGGMMSRPMDASPAENAVSSLMGGYTVDRSVVRKATLELRADDVRAAFLKAQQIISEANGEYIEQSSLTGSDASIRASLTLRVRADRLSEVLNALRPLGTVTNEQLGGDDVTAQVVDIDARLRSERQVEKELLELLDSRPNASVKEILELRQQLQIVRDSIERMVAQQQKLSRLVSLATVLVIIAPTPPEDEPVEKEDTSAFSDYFNDAIDRSWTVSVHALTDSLAFAVRVIVGGAIWWALAIALLLVARSMQRRRIAAGVV